MQSKFRVGAVSAATLIALTLAGCSTAGGGSSDGDGTTTLGVLSPNQQEVFQPVIDAFEAANPDITIEYEYVPFENYNSIVAQRVGGQDASVDILWVDAGTVGSLVTTNYLIDLEDLRSKAEESSLASAVEGNVFQDKLWAVPMWTSAQFLYYNKDLLDAAGLPYPSPDPEERLTWQQLLADGQAAQAAGATWGVLLGQINRYYQLQPLPESAGGGPGVTGEDLLTADITNQGWQDAMNWYSELFESGAAPRGVASEQMGELFAGGEAAYLVQGPWQIPANAAADGLNYGIAPIPYMENGTPAMPTGSWNLGITTSSDAVDAAKKFLE